MVGAQSDCGKGFNMMTTASFPRRKVAEQTYTFAELCRLLHIPFDRARILRATGELLGPDVIVPGGGRKAERWTATRIALIQAKWSPSGQLTGRSAGNNG
jgi:hypothetical protein